MTLPTTVIDLGTKEQASGLTLVAISRVRRLQGLALYEPVLSSRLQNIKNGKNMEARLAEERRLDAILRY